MKISIKKKIAKGMYRLRKYTNEFNKDTDWIREDVVEIIVVAILLVSMFFLSYKASEYVNSTDVKIQKNRTIVLDAGHGG